MQCDVGCVWCRCLNLFRMDDMALMRENIRLTEYSDYDVMEFLGQCGSHI